MEHEVDEPRPEEDHGRQRVGTIVIEGDIDSPRNRHADLELRSEGADVNDDHSGCALIRPGFEDEAHDTRPGSQLTDRKIAAGHELGRETRRQPPPDLVYARPRAVGCHRMRRAKPPASTDRAFAESGDTLGCRRAKGRLRTRDERDASPARLASARWRPRSSRFSRSRDRPASWSDARCSGARTVLHSSPDERRSSVLRLVTHRCPPEPLEPL